MIQLLFFIIPMVCAPFDYTDCSYTILIYDENPRNAWAKYDPNFKYLIFVGEWQTKIDCFGMSWWTHEWLHAEIGPWHPENDECVVKNQFKYKFENSKMANRHESPNQIMNIQYTNQKSICY